MHKTIYLLRHGETKWNKEWLFQGQQDVDLSEEGLKQARKVSERLKDININSIYSSDLKRAFRTAQIVAENYNLTVQKNPDLREINFGDWEGRHYNHFKEEERDYFHKWFKEPLKYRVPGGESLPELQERVLAFLNLVVNQENEEKKEEEIIITAHGGPIKIIIAHILNMDIKNMSRLVISPASLSIIHYYKTHPYLTLFNDVCHLLE